MKEEKEMSWYTFCLIIFSIPGIISFVGFFAVYYIMMYSWPQEIFKNVIDTRYLGVFFLCLFLIGGLLVGRKKTQQEKKLKGDRK